MVPLVFVVAPLVCVVAPLVCVVGPPVCVVGPAVVPLIILLVLLSVSESFSLSA